MNASFCKKLEGSGKKEQKAPFPKNVAYDHPYIVPKCAKPLKKKIPPPTLPKPKLVSKHVVVTNVDKLGSKGGKLVKDIVNSVDAPVDDERIFYEQHKQSIADRRHGKERKVDKLARDYEYGVCVKKPKQRPTRKATGEKRTMGKTVGGRVAGFESLRQDKDMIRQQAEQKKMELTAEKDADLAQIEAQDAKREKELHAEKLDHLAEKMEKVLEQELQAKLSNMSEKKENIVEEEFKESVREAEANAELEKKKIEEKMQREEAARRKWYDMRAPVPAGFIYTPKNVQEKKADMDALVKHIGTTANPCQKTHRR